MPIRADRPDDSDCNRREEAADEQIGREEQDRARRTDAPQVDERQENEHGEAKGESPREQCRKRRYDRADTRCNGDRDVQDVVERERSRGEQTRTTAQVLSRDCVRPPPLGYAAIVWR